MRTRRNSYYVYGFLLIILIVNHFLKQKKKFHLAHLVSGLIYKPSVQAGPQRL